MEREYKSALAKGVRLALIAAVTLISTTAFVHAQAGSEKSPMPRHIESSQPAVTGVNHVLKATYITTCLPNCTAFFVGAATAVPLDVVTTINCPAPLGKTCTVTDDAWIELLNTGGSGNPEALGFYLDGVDADYLYNGGSGTYGGSQFDGLAHKTAVAIQVSRGTHTVQTLTYSVLGAWGAGWTATYRVYVP